MRYIRNLGGVAILLLAIAAPSTSMAQSPLGDVFQNWLAGHPNAGSQLQQNPYQIYDPDWRAQHPEVQRYINDNPAVWNGMRSRARLYYGEPLNRFLKNHPNMSSRLAANPDLIYDRRFRDQHPDLKEFLDSHPDAWRKLAAGPVSNPRGWGAYDSYHQWRDANWWHEQIAPGCIGIIPSGPTIIPIGATQTATSMTLTSGTTAAGGASIIATGSQRHHPDWFKHQQHDAWKEQQHAEHEADKAQQHAEHEAYKNQQHAEHEADKAQGKPGKHGHDHGGPGDHDNH